MVVTSHEYMPFGEDWITEGDTKNAPKYNSQELDKESGYYFYNARHYDPEIARFVTADTIIPVEFDSQGWNRFAYVRNNPILYKDPTGHKWYYENQVSSKQAQSGNYLKMNFENKKTGDKMSLYTDNPKKDLSSKHENNKTTYMINKKGNYVATKWENPSDKVGRVTTINDPVITKGRTFNKDTHPGIDEISASKGGAGIENTSLKAGNAGRVSFVRDYYSENVKGAGKYVEIDYGDGKTRRTLHMNDVNVKPGDWVNSNTKIGTAGKTESPGGPHVHDEIYIRDNKDNMPINRSVTEPWYSNDKYFPGRHENLNDHLRNPLKEQK